MSSKKRVVFDVRDVFTNGEKYAKTSDDSTITGDSNVFFVKLSASVVLIGFTHPAILHFHGILSVKCIYGKIDCYGLQLPVRNGRNDCNQTVFSLLDRSALYLATYEGEEADKIEVDELKEFDLTADKVMSIMKKVGPQGAIVLASSKLDHYRHWDSVLQSANLSVFPRRDSNGPITYRAIEEVLDCVIGTADDHRIPSRLLPHPSWNKVADLLSKNHELNPIVLVYGGKGVGKSTALKFFMNRIHSICHEAMFIDFDVGQSEVTICGSVTAAYITDPFLGSNFTHLEIPSESANLWRSHHLGTVNVSQCLGSYVKAVEKIMSFVRQNECRIPWFVNTMGMHKGIGPQLLAKIISIVYPDYVIEVKSCNNDFNFPYPMTPSRVNELFPSKNLEYKFHVIESVTQPTTKSSLNPVSLRNMVAYVYLSSLLTKRSFRNVKFCRVTEAQRSSLALGDVIALCYDGDILIGYGLVVKLSSENSIVGIVSPTSNKDLRYVISILRTNVNLKPHSLLQGFKTLQGPVSHFSRFDTSKIKKTRSKIDLYKVLFSTDVS